MDTFSNSLNYSLSIFSTIQKCDSNLWSAQTPINLVADSYLFEELATKFAEHFEFDEGDGCDAVHVLANDHAWEVSFVDASCTTHTLTWGDKAVAKNTMTMEQLHTHFPSEHTINGKHADAELHLVHKHYDSSSGAMDNAAALGVMLVVDETLSQEDSPFQKYWAAINTASDSMTANNWWAGKDYAASTRYSAEWEFDAIPADSAVKAYSEFLPKDKTLWHYVGSLTTYPCTNGVNWFLFQTPIYITALDLENLKSAVKNELNTLAGATPGVPFDEDEPFRTNRPIQPQGDRDVFHIPGLDFVSFIFYCTYHER
jgi:carbonic anhydrase